MSEILVRRASPAEVSSYIVPTWLQSYCLGLVGKFMRADARHAPGRERYWSNQRAKIERILSTATVSVRVADYEGEPVAWICDDQTNRTVHYVFCNRIFRRQGIAKQLLPEWFGDSNGGTVYLTALPPPWYSRPGPDGENHLWKPHVSIDLITAY